MIFTAALFRQSVARFRVVVTFLMFVLLGGAVTYWAITLLHPPRPAVELPPRVIESKNVFSEVAPRLSGVQGGGQAMATVDLRLLGLVSDGANGRAVLMKDAKPVTVALGEALEPGVFLRRIGRDFIELDVHGARQRIELVAPQNKAKGAEK